VSGDGEERGGEHGQGDVAVLGVVFADLVVVQSGFVLGELERFLDTPTTSGDTDEFGEGDGVAGVAEASSVGLLIERRTSSMCVPAPGSSSGQS
jgi:hypothetical protein